MYDISQITKTYHSQDHTSVQNVHNDIKQTTNHKQQHQQHNLPRSRDADKNGLCMFKLAATMQPTTKCLICSSFPTASGTSYRTDPQSLLVFSDSNAGISIPYRFYDLEQGSAMTLNYWTITKILQWTTRSLTTYHNACSPPHKPFIWVLVCKQSSETTINCTVLTFRAIQISYAGAQTITVIWDDPTLRIMQTSAKTLNYEMNETYPDSAPNRFYSICLSRQGA